MVPGKGWETGVLEFEFSDKTERDGFLAVEALLVPGKGWETGAVEVEISD